MFCYSQRQQQRGRGLKTGAVGTNTDEDEDVSQAAPATLLTVKLVPPGIDAPSQVHVRDITDTTALVTWFQPVAKVDGVSISYGPNSNPADRTLVELSSTDTQYHVGGLSPDTQYEVSLTARWGERTSVPVYDSFLTGTSSSSVCQSIQCLSRWRLECISFTHCYVFPRKDILI